MNTSRLRLRPFQQGCVDSILDTLSVDGESPYRAAYLMGAGGTGKTYIAAGVIAHYINDSTYPLPNRVIVLTPRNVVPQFSRVLFQELRFDRKLIQVLSYGGLSNKVNRVWFNKVQAETGADGDYETLVTPIFKPQLVILDEAQFIKHYSSARFKYVMGLAASSPLPFKTSFLLMSGTPGNSLNQMEAFIRLSGLSVEQVREMKSVSRNMKENE